jgi:L-asparaginase/Glu-tRNA(Gln) amidotransferase subunit D
MVSDSARQKDLLDGVIITTPGVGNIPFADGYNFRPFIQDAVARGIPVLIASQVPINPYTQAQYEATRVPEEFGAILTGNITATAAMAKFSWVIGWTKSEFGRRVGSKRYLDMIRTRMKANYVGEQGEYELSRPNIT